MADRCLEEEICSKKGGKWSVVLHGIDNGMCAVKKGECESVVLRSVDRRREDDRLWAVEKGERETGMLTGMWTKSDAVCGTGESGA
jgi:hypothetical protein